MNTLFCCMYVVVGLRTMLEWDEGLVFLINMGCLGATQTELEGWLSFPQPQSSTGKGGQGLRDCVAEKGLISWCWVCVDVLEVRLALV